MKKTSSYTAQVELLLKILPYIMQDKNLALKGGTAINLFMRDMPRLLLPIPLHEL